MIEEKHDIPPEIVLYITSELTKWDSEIDKKISDSQKRILEALNRHYKTLKDESQSLEKILTNAKVSLEKIAEKIAEQIIAGKKEELRRLQTETEKQVSAKLGELKDRAEQMIKELGERANELTKQSYQRATMELEESIALERRRTLDAERPAIQEELRTILRSEEERAVKGMKRRGLIWTAAMAGIALFTSIAAIISVSSASKSATYEARTLQYQINRQNKSMVEITLSLEDLKKNNEERLNQLRKKLEEDSAIRKDETNKELTALEGRIGREIDAKTKGLEVRISEKVSVAQYQENLVRISDTQQKLSEYARALENKYDDSLKRIDSIISETSKKEDYLTLKKILDDYKKELASYDSALTGLRQNDERTEKNYNDLSGRLRVVDEKLKEIMNIIEKLQKTD